MGQNYRLSMVMRLLAIGISSFGMLLLLPLVLSKLGEYQFGIWGMVSSITSYLLLLDFGIALACTRYLSIQAQSKATWTNIISNSLFLAIIIACILLVIALTLTITNSLGLFTDNQLLISRIVCIVMLEVAISIPLRMYLSILRTEVRYVDIGAFEVIRVVCRIGGIALALFMGADLTSIVILAAIVNILFFVLPLLSTYARHKTLFFQQSAINRKTLTELLQFSKFTAVSQSTEFLKFRTDSVLVSILIGITASAHYTIIVFIIMMVTQILMRFMSYWDTIIIRNIGNKQYQTAENTVFKSLEIGITLSILACLNLYIYGGFFITLWVGEQYQSLHNALLLLSLILFSISFQMATTPYLNGRKQEKTNAGIDFSEVLLKFALLIPFTALMGFNGFIIASVTAASVCGIGCRILAFARCSEQKTLAILLNIAKISIKPLLLGLLIATCYWLLSNFSGSAPYMQLISIGIIQILILALAYIHIFKIKALPTSQQQRLC
ncbi:MAG: lipopolysaccharide biosynthesis protein [Thiolinea sp.]